MTGPFAKRFDALHQAAPGGYRPASFERWCRFSDAKNLHNLYYQQVTQAQPGNGNFRRICSMAIEYVKKATKTAATGEDDPREVVIKMLSEIEQGGRAAWKDARALAIIACRGISR